MQASVQFVGITILLIISLAKSEESRDEAYDRKRNTQLLRKIDPDLQRKIDDYVENVYLPSAGVSTLGLSIVQLDKEGLGPEDYFDSRDKIIYSTGYGLANREKKILASNKTQFLIGSITKSFTAKLAVLLLTESFYKEWKGVLDKPISALLPNLNFTLNDKLRTNHVTLRDILAHRVCLTPNDATLMAGDLFPWKEVAYRARYSKEACDIRSNFVYNNQMYLLAAEIIEALTNFTRPLTFEQMITGIFSGPGMENSELGKLEDDYEKGLENRARPYYIRDNEMFPVNPELLKRVISNNPAGGIFSTPTDMAKYLRHTMLLYNSPVFAMPFQPSMFTSCESSTSFKQNEEDEGLKFLQYAYGLGWNLGTLGGYQHYSHHGRFPTFNSLASIFPGPKIGIFSSTNEEPLKVNQLVLHAFILKTLLGNENATEIAEKFKEVLEEDGKEKLKNLKERDDAGWFLKNLRAIAKNNTKNGTKAEIVGNYGNGASGNLQILEKFNDAKIKTQYFIQYGKWYQGWLEDWEGEDEGIFYKVNFTTDIVQDAYAAGEKGSVDYLAFDQVDSVKLFQIYSDGQFREWEEYKKGVGLETLPAIPWTDACHDKGKN